MLFQSKINYPKKSSIITQITLWYSSFIFILVIGVLIGSFFISKSIAENKSEKNLPFCQTPLIFYIYCSKLKYSHKFEIILAQYGIINRILNFHLYKNFSFQVFFRFSFLFCRIYFYKRYLQKF